MYLVLHSEKTFSTKIEMYNTYSQVTELIVPEKRN